MHRVFCATAIGAVVACGARTELGRGRTDGGGDDASSDAAEADGAVPEAAATPYCATLVGSVSSCDAGPESGYVIWCPAGTECNFFSGEWGCCHGAPHIQCSYGNHHSSCN